LEKNVRITVQTKQRDMDGNPAVYDKKHDGSYYEKGQWNYLIYEEEGETPQDKIKNMLKWKMEPTPVIELTRKGAINTTMVLERESDHKMEYRTPYGIFEFDIKTSKATIFSVGQRIVLVADYALSMDGEPFGKTSMKITVDPA
jgi:uncharacterized beta-barrel protein YwiB (DUF1934 family)